MARIRFLAAALLALPLAACEVDNSQLPEGAQKVDESFTDIQSALAALPSAQIAGQEQASEIPFMITGNLGKAEQAMSMGKAMPTIGKNVSKALPSIAAVFRVDAADLIAKRARTDEQGVTHIRYGQMKNGLPVVNEELIVHVDRDNNIIAANGTATDGEYSLAKANISEEAAKASALNNTSGSRLEVNGMRLVYVRPSPGEKLQLAYEAMVLGESADLMPIKDAVYVSAKDGSILARHAKIHSALNRKMYTANNGTSTPGTLKRTEGQAAVGDSHLDTNYTKLGDTYNCYKNNFGRDSLNNAGATLISTVHYSSKYTNAYWDGTQMVYGDSDGVQSAPLGLSGDVTTHELTHAVTENESNLTYSGESGGLNEAMSDIFGAYCESYASGTWSTSNAVFMVGDDVWTPNTAGDALRYMYDPAKDGSSHDAWSTSTKSVDVHYSSGVANLAFTLLSKGGTHPRGKTTTQVPGIGVQKAGAIYYKANTDLFTASTTYAQAKTYFESAATSLYGAGSPELAAVTASMIAVNVGGTVTPPAAVALTNGVAKTGLGTATGNELYYYLDVPASKASTFTTSGGTGDLDLYVKAGSQPTTSSYDCRPYKSGNAETCSIAAKTAATRIYVTLRAYSTFAGASLTGSY